MLTGSHADFLPCVETDEAMKAGVKNDMHEYYEDETAIS